MTKKEYIANLADNSGMILGVSIALGILSDTGSIKAALKHPDMLGGSSKKSLIALVDQVQRATDLKLFEITGDVVVSTISGKAFVMGLKYCGTILMTD
jgi:hypothetical protein